MVPVFIIGAVIAAIALYFTLTRKNSKYNYPPSPPGYSILKGGHAHLLPPGFEVHFQSNVFLRVARSTDFEMGRGVW
jgi:hypothetical protein